MKIIHGPLEIAGQVGITARAQRSLGYNSVSIVHTKHPFNYENDYYIYNKNDSRLIRNYKKLAFLKKYLTEFDVYHFHFAEPFYRYKSFYMDTKILRNIRNKKIFVEFWGSDVRLPTIEKERNPFFINSYNEDDQINMEKMKRWAEVTNGKVIISDHYFNVFLEKYFNDINIVGQRVETERFTPMYPNPENKRPIIMHAPSQMAFKGTKYLHKAINNLKRKYDFEYREITNMNHSRALAEYSKADIIVDQLCGGAHGVFACEAMALGKPVICYILPELLDGYPEGFPIINANPNTIEAVLEEWIQKHEERHNIGKKSRKYAEIYHDSRVVAKKIINIYRGL